MDSAGNTDQPHKRTVKSLPNLSREAQEEILDVLSALIPIAENEAAGLADVDETERADEAYDFVDRARKLLDDAGNTYSRAETRASPSNDHLMEAALVSAKETVLALQCDVDAFRSKFGDYPGYDIGEASATTNQTLAEIETALAGRRQETKNKQSKRPTGMTLGR